MLELKNITKEYVAGDQSVMALKGVSMAFRKSEFVSILGPSGCGKTTLLNIIGGLDHYTDGDLIIRGRSTKSYKDSDWDSYRNHSIGFVFQSYNLIPHQSVLSNVELALTLSGISRDQRRQKAKEVLQRVGLGDHLSKKPSQLSGGQMQRVAIARALINDPDILLADEPTGALDTETSIQVMELLKEVAQERLVIMVTHNPELAERYSTRIIRLLDGRVLDDSAPYTPDGKEDNGNYKTGRTSMSLFTATGLSLNNLMTKKARTFLTIFAGSIGIIGIALILSLSNGIQNYIDKVQEDTLSTYPLTIQSETVDMSSLMSTLADTGSDEISHDRDKVYSSTVMQDMMDSMTSTTVRSNNLTDFKEYLESNEELEDAVSDIQYTYGTTLYVYNADTSNGIQRINPSTIFDNFVSGWSTTDQGLSTVTSMVTSTYTNSLNVWQQMLDNDELMESQYDIIAGRWPESYDEVVLAVDKNNELYDIYLYSLGLKDQQEIKDIMLKIVNGEQLDAEALSYTYDEIMNLEYRLVLPTDMYSYNEETGTWEDMSQNESYMSVVISQAPAIKIVGIIRPNEDAVATSITGAIGYTSELTDYVVTAVENSEIIQAQLADPGVDVITGLPFDDGTAESLTDSDKAEAFTEYCAGLSNTEKAALYQQIASTPSQEQIDAMVDQQLEGVERESLEAMIVQTMAEQSGMSSDTIKAYLANMTDEELFEQVRKSMAEQMTQQYAESMDFDSLTAQEAGALLDAQLQYCDEAQLAELYDTYMPAQWAEGTCEDTLKALGYSTLGAPSSISIYADSFENKDKIVAAIESYNQSCIDAGDESAVIDYTDYVGLIMSSVSTIINVISYVLIAFVSISLVVSSIMIGIITYISVLERTREIGILRSVGASKKDISRVFNAETLIVGTLAGVFGIGVTLLLNLPINAIIHGLTNVPVSAELPWQGGVILILLSMGLTLLAGLLPSGMAARKDPVEALRTE